MICHVPVLLEEVLECLRPWENVRSVIDGTLGCGGHAEAILEKCSNAKLLGVDQDPAAIDFAVSRLAKFGERFFFNQANFRNLTSLVKDLEWGRSDALLLDLGLSNLQLTTPERGFSFQENGELDMRMDAGSGIFSEKNAREILNHSSLLELTRLFREYGEDPFAYQISRAIVQHRERQGPIQTTSELVEVIRKALPAPVQRKMGGHPARRVFQALRIAVNDEINALKEVLSDAPEILNESGGKLIILSYHSLEDRIVKNYFKQWEQEKRGKMLYRHPLRPSVEEIEHNYRARSAKLRAFLFDG